MQSGKNVSHSPPGEDPADSLHVMVDVKDSSPRGEFSTKYNAAHQHLVA